MVQGLWRGVGKWKMVQIQRSWLRQSDRRFYTERLYSDRFYPGRFYDLRLYNFRLRILG